MTFWLFTFDIFFFSQPITKCYICYVANTCAVYMEIYGYFTCHIKSLLVTPSGVLHHYVPMPTWPILVPYIWKYTAISYVSVVTLFNPLQNLALNATKSKCMNYLILECFQLSFSCGILKISLQLGDGWIIYVFPFF